MDRHFPFTTWAYSHLFKVDGDSRTKSFALRLEYFFVGYIPSNVTFCVAMKKDALNNFVDLIVAIGLAHSRWETYVYFSQFAEYSGESYSHGNTALNWIQASNSQ